MTVLRTNTNLETDDILLGAVVDTLDEIGYTPEEAVPVLVGAIIHQCRQTDDPNRALDEAVELLNEVTL